MALTKEQTAALVKKFGKNENDTGSTEVQIAILTERINHLTEHLKKNNNNINKALMCYNCGAGGAARLWRQGTYSTAYSRAIIERYNYYNAIYENSTKTTRVSKKSSTLLQSK